jgi:anti-anti-sigma factor
MNSNLRDQPLSISAFTCDRDLSCTVVSLAGEAGISDCGWIRRLLELQAAQGYSRVVVDLSRLSSMDWWVVLILTWAGRVIRRRGGVLVLASPQPEVARLLNAADASNVYYDVQRASGTCTRHDPASTNIRPHNMAVKCRVPAQVRSALSGNP